MQIIKYNKTYENIWDEFIKDSKNGNVFHTRKFLNYHKDKFKDVSILIYKKINYYPFFLLLNLKIKSYLIEVLLMED